MLDYIGTRPQKDFVANLQREISDALSARPRKADEAYFTGKVITTETGPLEITPVMARQIYKYLLKNGCFSQNRIFNETPTYIRLAHRPDPLR